MNQSLALKILQSGSNVFLTGEPGSGKTFVINQYVAYLRSHKIKTAVTASTGIAATHIGGTTIHSWSGIGIKNQLSSYDLRNIATNTYVKKRINSAKVLIIDEISMLPPETLQMIDSICREIKKRPEPFGGMQVILVGDFFQLPPINKKIISENSQENLFEESPARFAYNTQIWQQAEFVTCYISEQHRQDDQDLVSLLSKIRNNSFDELSFDHIKSRKVDSHNASDSAPKLFSHNIDVDIINDQMLNKIESEGKRFTMTTKGHEALIATMKKGCLSPDNLILKIGACVMFTKNNPNEGYVNGTLGVVEDFDLDSGLPIVKTRDGRKIEARYADWVIEEDGKIKGTLTQIPLRLAWAITVHKSQGISLDEAVIDLSKVFEYGQGYVAISRVKRLSGVHILGWNDMAFQVDPEVLKEDISFRMQSENAEKLFSSFSDDEINKLKNEFIINCEGEINASNVSSDSNQKANTCKATLALWNEGKQISQIAEIRNLSEKTILGHIEKLIKNNDIEKSDISQIISANISKDISKIQNAFKKLDTDKLKPVFEYFDGKYSYEDLRLVKISLS